MEAHHSNLLNFLQKAAQFIIPVYQRTYSWEWAQCERLIKDIERIGRRDERKAGHFIGSIVYIMDNAAHNAPLIVIDGQQRLTTLSLLLLALRRTIGDDEPYDGFFAEKIYKYYLINDLEKGNKRYRLLLADKDRDTLLSLIDDVPIPHVYSQRLVDNFGCFLDFFQHIEKDKLKIICRGLTRLLVVTIGLERGRDNPQLIFETMNSTGLDLSQTDLIRNYILMDLESNDQDRLYKNYWRQVERDLNDNDGEFNKFMRHYLTVKTGKIPRLDGVYEAFKIYFYNLQADSLENMLKELRSYARYYAALILNRETTPDLQQIFSDLRELASDVTTPFLLRLYHDYEVGFLKKENFIKIIRLIEAYIFRRAVCGLPTNSHSKTFATLYRSLNNQDYVGSLKASFQLMRSYRRFPGDEEFKDSFQQRDMYNFSRRSYWLHRYENDGKKEKIAINNYTIEHIMPQNLSPQWQQNLGENWQSIHEALLHTSGNLTLTGYNAEYGNRPFLEKRDHRPGGYASSPVHLNEDLRHLEQWTQETIKRRGKKMAERAVLIWVAPNLSDEELSHYAIQQPERTEFTLASYLTLQNEASVVRRLFDDLRKEIMQLDENIREEFLKLYIAYKAESNFIEIVPQANQLKLYFDFNLNELDDPLGLCRDVSNIGHWGTGNTQAHLTRFDDIAYIIGLTRQVLEKQLDKI